MTKETYSESPSLTGRRQRGSGKDSAPIPMLPEMQHMLEAAKACGLDVESASMDKGMDGGRQMLRMSMVRSPKAATPGKQKKGKK